MGAQGAGERADGREPELEQGQDHDVQGFDGRAGERDGGRVGACERAVLDVARAGLVEFHFRRRAEGSFAGCGEGAES